MPCLPVPKVPQPQLPFPFVLAPPALPGLPGLPDLCCRLPPPPDLPVDLPPIPSLIINPAIVAVLRQAIDKVNAYLDTLQPDCPRE